MKRSRCICTYLKRLTLVSLLALTGCAVLTIEVDVYKGVLSDEKSTQINYLRVPDSLGD